MIKNDPKWTRLYYRTQEMLAKHFIDDYSNNGDIGDVREQSSLPQTLNRDAEVMVDSIVRRTTEREDYVLKINKESYEIYKKRLPNSLQAMLNSDYEADNYYAVVSQSKIVSCFQTSEDGYLSGLFSLVKGIGKESLDLQLTIAEKDAHDTIRVLMTDCYSGPMVKHLMEAGFNPYRTDTFDKILCGENWDYNSYGTPDVIYFIKEI